jgi:hypothetical protein
MKDTIAAKKTPLPKHDNFLADAIHPRSSARITYMDGFRFGLGFFAAGLLVFIVLGGLTWGLIAGLNLH